MKDIKIINSEQELQNLFDNNRCIIEIDESSFGKTRYVNPNIYNGLFRYKLNFDPYINIAERCSMDFIDILRSPKTNRFYIGFLNTGGHAFVFEIRPVRLSEILNYSYIQDMFINHCQKLDWGIDLNEDYVI